MKEKGPLSPFKLLTLPMELSEFLREFWLMPPTPSRGPAEPTDPMEPSEFRLECALPPVGLSVAVDVKGSPSFCLLVGVFMASDASFSFILSM